MLIKFIIGNMTLVGCTFIGYRYYIMKRNEEMYKNTRVFHLVMSKLRSNPGAIHFLGEPIKDGKLTIVDEKKDDNTTIYRVKVGVKGVKTIGCMHFWLLRPSEESDAELTRIELQIKDIKQRLLIFEENKSTTTPKDNLIS